MSYNVRSFRGGVEAVADVVHEQRPNIVLLQECGTRAATRRFARALHMEVVASHRPFRRAPKAVLFGRPWRLAGVEVRDLSHQSRTIRRGFVAAHLRTTGLSLALVSCHLGLAPRQRERHARELTDALMGGEGGLVLGVDLNEGPEAPAVRWIAERLYDAFAVAGEGPGETFPAAAPTARIDYLFVAEGFRVLRAWVATEGRAERASDHLPVVADLEFGEPRVVEG
jgi:endonuclease/exonuclease/phosphatase family metal-dependent hydrolase